MNERVRIVVFDPAASARENTGAGSPPTGDGSEGRGAADER
jgi:hypothetical protein